MMVVGESIRLRNWNDNYTVPVNDCSRFGHAWLLVNCNVDLKSSCTNCGVVGISKLSREFGAHFEVRIMCQVQLCGVPRSDLAATREKSAVYRKIKLQIARNVDKSLRR